MSNWHIAGREKVQIEIYNVNNTLFNFFKKTKKTILDLTLYIYSTEPVV